MAEHSDGEQLTSTGTIVTGTCYLCSATVVAPGNAVGTVTLYPGVSAAGTAKHVISTPVGAGNTGLSTVVNFIPPLWMEDGAHAVLVNVVSASFVYMRVAR